MNAGAKVVIVGAGIVGCSLADELTTRGWTDVTVCEQGPLFATGGSSSHAPGLVFQTNPSKTMTAFARYTVTKLGGLDLDGDPCFRPVGGLEVATTPARLADLARKRGWATSWGVEATLLDADACVALHPLLRRGAVLGGLHVASDGLAKPLGAAEAQARRAIAAGARFLAHTRVVDVRRDPDTGRVAGVATDGGPIPADVVVSCAGMWGPRLGALAGTPVPLVPMAHQYATTTPLPALAAPPTGAAGATAHPEASRPILRHQDRDLYFREHHDRIGIGSYAHRPMPIDAAAIPSHHTGPGYHPGPAGADEDDGGTWPGGPDGEFAGVMPSMLAFTPDDFAPSWADAVDLLPGLADAKIEHGFNGLFSFTADGFPLLGESAALPGFWLAEAVWITHSAGVAKAVAESLVTGQADVDLHECDVNRFEPVQRSPEVLLARASQSFVEVYDVIHPAQPVGPGRPLRTSPFYPRQLELGAEFTEGGGWERPLWFAANDNLRDRFPVADRRDAWAARFWSPIAGAEALATRAGVALYDMTPLTRLEVTGPGAAAFLTRMTTNTIDREVGRVVYSLLLDGAGGVRSDLTVTRLGPARFLVGANGPLDLDRLTRALPADGSVAVTDVTGGTCCVGVWGPRARDLVAPLTPDDVSNAGFGYFRARPITVAGLPVVAARVSYVGELGWELTTSADLGLALWDRLAAAGAPLGVVAGGRAAFDSLRMEKGYRRAGVDMTSEHDPFAAGMGFAVRSGDRDFVGGPALAGRPPGPSHLACLTLDDPADVVLGQEPVWSVGSGARPVGYVTSAAYGHTIGACVAYAWLPTSAVAGTAVEVEYFGARLPAHAVDAPLVDADRRRLQS